MLKVRRAVGAARDTAGVRVRQRVTGHGRPGVRDVTAVARVIAPHDLVPLERGLEGGGGVCALRLGVVLGDHADDLSGRSLKTHCNAFSVTRGVQDSLYVETIFFAFF